MESSPLEARRGTESREGPGKELETTLHPRAVHPLKQRLTAGELWSEQASSSEVRPVLMSAIMVLVPVSQISDKRWERER